MVVVICINFSFISQSSTSIASKVLYTKIPLHLKY